MKSKKEILLSLKNEELLINNHNGCFIIYKTDRLVNPEIHRERFIVIDCNDDILTVKRKDTDLIYYFSVDHIAEIIPIL